ncbi:MAG: CDP-alcohol phosphatidyltransferase family protein, partial [Actinobacteria bacterium]|nr:CDP-alcohol phosphatidyltransferase family protein [Actinomycetota bacterium]
MSRNPTVPTAHEAPSPGEGEGRVLTIPNVISLLRLACIPLFWWLLIVQDRRAAAAYLLAGLGATD